MGPKIGHPSLARMRHLLPRQAGVLDQLAAGLALLSLARLHVTFRPHLRLSEASWPTERK